MSGYPEPQAGLYLPGPFVASLYAVIGAEPVIQVPQRILSSPPSRRLKTFLAQISNRQSLNHPIHSLMPERSHGIHLGGPAGRKVRRQQSGRREEQGQHDEGRGICWTNSIQQT